MLRNRNAALEQQLASYGSISTPPVARRRNLPAGPQQGLQPQHVQQMQPARHAHQLQPPSPQMQYADVDGPQDPTPPVPMSPMVTSRQQPQYVVPGTPMQQQRMPRGMRSSSVMPTDMAPQLPLQPQHLGPSQPYGNPQEMQEYTADPVRADYPAKRQRLDHSNAWAFSLRGRADSQIRSTGAAEPLLAGDDCHPCCAQSGGELGTRTGRKAALFSQLPGPAPQQPGVSSDAGGWHADSGQPVPVSR